MIRHKLGRAVQWKDGDAHMVGRVVVQPHLDTDAPLVVMPITTNTQIQVLVALSHTRELVSVPMRALSDYPSAPIPEPTK